MEKHKMLGIEGEKAGAEFLEEKGFHILHERYHCRYGEIDLIAAKEKLLCFVEVKTRLPGNFSEGAFSIHVHKKDRLIKTGYHFLQNNPELRYEEMRFDCLLISPDAKGKFAVDWRENIFID